MDRIRLLARIMFWAGWVSIALGVVLTVGSFLTVPPEGLIGSQPALMMMAGNTIFSLLMSLGLFFGWGVLTLLCEITDQLKEQLNGAE